MERPEEEHLLKSARHGDENAFFRLFDEHNPALFRFAFRLTGSTADAEDIVQECFLSLLQPDSAFDPGRAAVRTYLFGAVRNQALKRLRAREISRFIVPGGKDGNSPEARVYQLELCDAVAQAVAQLPLNQREVLVLAHYEQLPLAEVAELLRIDLGAVKSRLQRARAALKDALADFSPSASRCASKESRR